MSLDVLARQKFSQVLGRYIYCLIGLDFFWREIVKPVSTELAQFQGTVWLMGLDTRFSSYFQRLYNTEFNFDTMLQSKTTLTVQNLGFGIIGPITAF